MSENVRFEIPKEMRSMAEASFEQARKTFEKFLDSAKETAGSVAERNETMRAGAKDISAKAIAMPRETCRPRSTMPSSFCMPRISPR
jgi:hypothetical protein